MKNFFSEHRFVFMGEKAPEHHEERSRAEVLAARKQETREIYSTARDRQRMISGKKKVEGEKFEEKEARVSDSVNVLKLNGMLGMVRPDDKMKVLNGGQIYEMGGEKYLKVAVRRERRTVQPFVAYIKFDDVSSSREKEGEDLSTKFAEEMQVYLDSVAKDRFYIQISDYRSSGGSHEVTIKDKENSKAVVSWAMLDIERDSNGNYIDTVGNDGSPVFRARENEVGRQTAATMVMSRVGLEGVPAAEKRVRLGSSDAMHYSLPDAVARAQKEVDDYLLKNPSKGVPGEIEDVVEANPAAIKAGGEKLVKALLKEVKNNLPGFDLKIEQTGELVTVFDKANRVILASAKVDPEGRSYSVGVNGNIQHMRLADVVKWMGVAATENME